MKAMETVIRRIFFYGAFILASLAVLEKGANLMKYTLLGNALAPARLLEFAAIGLLFSIAMQLHQIRILLGTRSSDLPK